MTPMSQIRWISAGVAGRRSTAACPITLLDLGHVKAALCLLQLLWKDTRCFGAAALEGDQVLW